MGFRETLGLGDSSNDHDDKPPTYSASSYSQPQSSPQTAQSYTPTQPPFQSRFASLSMHDSDEIRLLHFPTPVIDTCRQVITSTWKRGIKQERDYGGAREFKVHGYPWSRTAGQTTEARRVICGLLAALHQHGWVLITSTDVSRKMLDKDTLLFRHQTPTPAPCEWFSVAFSKNDLIRLIDPPKELGRSLVERLGPAWVKDHAISEPGVNRIKLDGSPWWAEGTKTMKVRELLLTFLDVLEADGWTIYASVSQEHGGPHHNETDTWYCSRPQGWIRGAPVYHG